MAHLSGNRPQSLPSACVSHHSITIVLSYYARNPMMSRGVEMTVGTGRVALVTGASSGIGEAPAQELLAAGFIVYGTSRKASAGEHRGGVTFLPLDVTDDRS